MLQLLQNFARVILLIFLLVSCSGMAPDIDYISWQLSIDVNSYGYQREVLSVFIRARDDDGIEDLEEAYLVRLNDSTSWWIPNESWYVAGEEQDYPWLVSTGIEPVGGIEFTAGAYRIILYDRSGQSDVVNFNLVANRTTIGSVKVVRPTLLADGLELNDSFYRNNGSLLGYDYGGKLLFRNAAVPGKVSFDTLVSENSELASLLIVYRLADGTMVRIGPYSAF